MRPLLLMVVMMMAPAPAIAQPAPFTGSAGLLSYTVEAARAERLEAVLQRILTAHAVAPIADAQVPRLDVRLLRGRSTPDWTVFVLLFDRITPGRDYSVEALIAAGFSADEADAILREFTEAARGAGRVALDLDLLRRVTPDDALRSRLERELGPLDGAGGGGGAVTDQTQLDALRRPGWAIDRLTFTVAYRGGDAWLQWSGAVRNTSPVEALRGRVVIQFHDAAGNRVAVSPSYAVALAELESQVLSGEVRASTIDAGRVTRASAAYTAE